MKQIENKSFDEERALYGIDGAEIRNCRFEGPADGESALKEAKNLTVSDCFLDLRYPFWHTSNVQVSKCDMTENCRAGIWYGKNLSFDDTKFGGIKAIRECEDVKINNSEIVSPEFGWFSNNINIKNSNLESEYVFLHTNNIEIDNLNFKGKYSFQYCNNVIIRNSYLDTKDAFWHSSNVVVYDSIVKGEYLAWYAESIKFVRCKIIGTQPLCYTESVIMEDCEMEGTDLAFEYSNVDVHVNSSIDSVKNPYHGTIEALSIDEIIIDENAYKDSDCKIVELSKEKVLV